MENQSIDPKTDFRRLRAILLFAATIAFAASPFWIDGFGGFDPNRYPIPQIDPPIQPAGYAFSIWGVIYLWLIAMGGYGLFARSDAVDWDAGRLPMIVSLVLGAAWIPVAQSSPIWATVMIWAMLGSALLALARSPSRDLWLNRAPAALYAGWLTAASFVSLGILGTGYGVVLDELGWAWLCLGAALVAGFALWRALPPAPLYPAAIGWGVAAVAVQNWGTQPLLAIAAGLGATALLAAAIRSARLQSGNPPIQRHG